jgi:inner membrane protein involved in colicin E2 resistance
MIHLRKGDSPTRWRCGRNSHHILECIAKKTSKSTELATPVAAITKKGKRQRTEDESDGEDKQNAEPVTKQPKNVATVTQNLEEDSPEMQSHV